MLATRLLWLIAAALVLLAGCSSSRSASGRQSASALDLIGEWHVDARDAQPHTVLLLGDDIEVWMPCGALDANWAADASGQFVAIMYSAPAACLPLPAWLAKATSFTVAGSTAYLLDADRQPLARLSRTSVPVGDAAALPAAPYPPVLDATLRARLSPPSALPARIQPANGRDLIGRWLPAEPGANPKAYLGFATDGTWHSYDGYNSGDGPWRDTGGHIVAAAGAMPAVGCDDMTDLSQPLLNAAQVGITPDGTLELFDAQGSVVARLRR